MRRFSPSRAAVVRTGIVFVAITATAIPVYAQSSASTDTAPGAVPLRRAHEAWDSGDFDLAPALYRSALDAGGLAREQVLEAYVRIGASMAVAGKKKPALVAFRNAALLDPGFQLPPEAGKKASLLADKARRDQERVGSLTLAMRVSDEVESGSPFAVDVTMAPARVALVDTLAFEAHDSLTGRAYVQQLPPSAHTTFDVPTRMTLPDATLVVRIEARDAHANELMTAEKHVHVTRPAVVAVLPRAPVPQHGHVAAADNRTASRESSGGFWSSPWPYVLGGAALAAGGAAVWFATRPTDEVSVGAARVELVH